MEEFNNSVAKVVNHSILSDYISLVSKSKNCLVDIGSGDCSLLSILRLHHERRVIGIDIDPEKVSYGASKGFNIIMSDIQNAHEKLIDLHEPLTLHAGFCIFNTFPQNVLYSIINNLSSLSNVDEILFEIQNPVYFSQKYPANKLFTTKINGMYIKSWNTNQHTIKGHGKLLFMEYYNSYSDELIHTTKDEIYPHNIDAIVVFLESIGYSSVNCNQWPVRFDAEESHSHYYIHATM